MARLLFVVLFVCLLVGGFEVQAPALCSQLLALALSSCTICAGVEEKGRAIIEVASNTASCFAPAPLLCTMHVAVLLLVARRRRIQRAAGPGLTACSIH